MPSHPDTYRLSHNLEIPQEYGERLRALAKENCRSVTGEIRFALLKHLREQGQPSGA